MAYKTIQDTIHGSVKFNGPFLDLLECPEVQRLNEIKQLGLTKLVFPGANHTRIEHSIGTYHVAERMSESLDLSEDEKNTVMAAAFLHDVGHAPLSHTLEAVIADKTGKDHMDVTQEIIKGEEFRRETGLRPEDRGGATEGATETAEAASEAPEEPKDDWEVAHVCYVQSRHVRTRTDPTAGGVRTVAIDHRPEIDPPPDRS